jgi:hypothetical protein
MTWLFVARWKPRGSSSSMVMVEVRECVYARVGGQKTSKKREVDKQP